MSFLRATAALCVPTDQPSGPVGLMRRPVVVGKTGMAPYTAIPENSDPSGSRATVILKGQRVRRGAGLAGLGAQRLRIGTGLIDRR